MDQVLKNIAGGFGSINYSAMEWAGAYWWPSWCILFFVGCMIAMSPLKTHHEQSFTEMILILIRKAIIWAGVILAIMPPVMLYIYDMTTGRQLANSTQVFLDWFLGLAADNWFLLVGSAMSGLLIRLIYKRWIIPFISKFLRTFRNIQTEEELSDIRDERNKFLTKDFLPSRYYKEGKIFMALDAKGDPIYVPLSTWRETNMQIIGPTRYGKGVILGNIFDQSIMMGDSLWYIDPKRDKFGPHVMYQAAQKAGRKFYYLSLHDDGYGAWNPFTGGSDRDALARLQQAFGLELTGDPGTDFYKTQERRDLLRAVKKSRKVHVLRKELADTEANRLKAELESWDSIDSLNGTSKNAFSIEKALQENAVVYVQGDLNDTVVLTATKMFIVELIQEIRRLDPERERHATVVVDEVSFLTSKILAQALATIVGFRANFVLAYQSQNDLLNIGDKTVNGQYIYQSINVNSQLKAIYGGADFDNAEYVANISGTVVKEVAKMEKTEISEAGGEKWDKGRMVGGQEENLITTNVMLTLPPRICVFVQPQKLATVSYTSFVPVKDLTALTEFLDEKKNGKKLNDDAPAKAKKTSFSLAKLNPFRKDQDTSDDDTVLSQEAMDEFVSTGIDELNTISPVKTDKKEAVKTPQPQKQIDESNIEPTPKNIPAKPVQASDIADSFKEYSAPNKPASVEKITAADIVGGKSEDSISLAKTDNKDKKTVPVTSNDIAASFMTNSNPKAENNPIKSSNEKEGAQLTNEDQVKKSKNKARRNRQKQNKAADQTNTENENASIKEKSVIPISEVSPFDEMDGISLAKTASYEKPEPLLSKDLKSDEDAMRAIFAEDEDED